MRVVIAPDSFKEACTAQAAAEAIARGWRSARPGDTLILVPMADGGEGTVAAVASAWQGGLERVDVHGPLGKVVVAAYACDPSRGTAVIEMAAASGLALVPQSQRDPLRSSTQGTGELIAHALDSGARRVIVGVGGSATNDGGSGALRALGIRFLDVNGNELPPGGAALARLHCIDVSQRYPLLCDSELLVACDVDNPLCGPRGASVVYGPQKGASPEMVRELDSALMRFAAVVAETVGQGLDATPGAGAAGGLAFGLMSLAGAVLRPGVQLVAEAVALEEHIRGASLVITGEGRLDAQTLHGKTPLGVAAIAREQGVPVIALAGQLGPGYEGLFAHGVTAAYGINRDTADLPTALRDTSINLERVAREIAIGFATE